MVADPGKPLPLLVNTAVGEPLPDDAGVDSPNTLAAITGEDADEPIRDSIVLQSLGAEDLAIRQGPRKLIPWIGSGGISTKPGRVEPTPGEPVGQLYHLGNDPEEQRNLYDVHPDVVLVAKGDRRSIAQRNTCNSPIPNRANPV